VIRVEKQEKEELGLKLKRAEREFEDVSRKLGQSQREIQAYENLEAKLREEIRVLKE
jgi:hypothetical protein